MDERFEDADISPGNRISEEVHRIRDSVKERRISRKSQRRERKKGNRERSEKKASLPKPQHIHTNGKKHRILLCVLPDAVTTAAKKVDFYLSVMNKMKKNDSINFKSPYETRYTYCYVSILHIIIICRKILQLNPLAQSYHRYKTLLIVQSLVTSTRHSCL